MARNSDKDVRAWADHAESDENEKVTEPHVKLDRRGLPLVPQPSDHKHDPLVRSNGQKQPQAGASADSDTPVPFMRLCYAHIFHRTGPGGTNSTSCS